MCASTRSAFLALLALLAGCTLGSDSPIPRDGPTMRAIYDGHMGADGAADTGSGVGTDLRVRALASGSVDLDGYTRDAGNEIDTRFARLPNPDLVLYVFPHLAGPSQSPVPGYSTLFPMYSRPAYALPGEAVGY